MQHALFNFLGSALVPVLGSDIAAGSAGYVHGGLVGVAALRAFPDELSVVVFYNLDFAGVAALLAAVRFCVELGVHDVFVDVLQNCHNSRNVVFHVWNFNIAYGSAWTQLLELAFKGEL